ncbi:MAG: hypothetical protein IPL40_05385 [Proteobacteria bacterium]|nr:hypothetical protein [Pseudomonadota bacterium]
MMTRSRIAALLTLCVAAGCTRDNPRVCETNSDCVAKTEAGQVPSGDLLCHPLDHICYAGCDTDANCQGPHFRPGQRCDVATRQCLPGPGDGGLGDGAEGSDARGTQAAGTTCGGAGVCASGLRRWALLSERLRRPLRALRPRRRPRHLHRRPRRSKPRRRVLPWRGRLRRQLRRRAPLPLRHHQALRWPLP